MIRKILLASALVAGTATVAWSPAYAGGWTYTGPHGGTATVTHWGGYPRYWGHGPCCYGGGVVAGAAAGLAVGTAVGVAAAAARPAYVAPPVYAPPPVYVAPPPVVYAPGYYYAP